MKRSHKLLTLAILLFSIYSNGEIAKSMIAARNYSNEDAVLPYDAEVEYLESTGTEIIYTDIVPLSVNKFMLKIRLPLSGSWGGIYRCYSDNSEPACQLTKWATGVSNIGIRHFARPSEGQTVFSNVVGDDYIVEATITKNTAIVNGVSKYIGPSYAGELNDTACLKFFYNTSFVGGRIYYFYIENQCDLIPVRIGDVGYLYDRMSGKMYGNSGSGSFIIGPDKEFE